MKSNIDTPVTTSVCWKFDGLICSIKDWSVQTSCMLVAWVCCTWLVFSLVATIITVNLLNIQWVMNEWLRTCLWNLVLFFAEGTSGDELTLLQLAGKDTLMMKIIIIYITIISIMCFLLRLILSQYHYIRVGHEKWLSAQSLMLTCLALLLARILAVPVSVAFCSTNTVLTLIPSWSIHVPTFLVTEPSALTTMTSIFLRFHNLATSCFRSCDINFLYSLHF